LRYRHVVGIELALVDTVGRLVLVRVVLGHVAAANARRRLERIVGAQVLAIGNTVAILVARPGTLVEAIRPDEGEFALTTRAGIGRNADAVAVAVRLRHAIGLAGVTADDDVLEIGDGNALGDESVELHRNDESVGAAASVEVLSPSGGFANIEEHDGVVAGTHTDRVGARTRVDGVVAVRRRDRVVPGTSVYDDRPTVRVDVVVAISAADERPGPRHDDVVAVAGERDAVGSVQRQVVGTA
jgi:hypothetical protein